MPSQRGHSCNGNPSSFPCESGLAHDGHAISLPAPASIQRVIPAGNSTEPQWLHEILPSARSTSIGAPQLAQFGTTSLSAIAHRNWSQARRLGVGKLAVGSWELNRPAPEGTGRPILEAEVDADTSQPPRQDGVGLQPCAVRNEVLVIGQDGTRIHHVVKIDRHH